MMMRVKKVLLIWLLSVFLFVACSSKGIPTDNSFKIKSRLLLFPTAFYDNVVLVNNKLTAFSVDINKPPSESISYAYEGDQNLQPFNPAQDPSCRKTAYNIFGGILPDGRLGLLKDCLLQSPPSIPSILAYDWQTSTLEQIVTGPIAKGDFPKTFTWNPQMTKGVQQMGDGLEGTVYWITPDGYSPMDIEIEDQGLTWNLKDYFEGKHKGVGSASFPAWSPDGTMIAFFASAYGIREDPLPKMNVHHALYLMNVSDLKPVQVLPEVPNAFRLRWSPDSKQLLFSGCMGSKFECALWFYDLETKKLALVDKGDFQDFTWVTNEKIVAIRNITLPFDPNQILEYTITRP